MAQHDYNLANQTGADFRADLNNALSAIVTVNSGSSEPSTTFAHQLWVDTSSNVLKIRNTANDAWLTTGVSVTASNTFDINAGTVNGITSLSFSSGATVASILDEDNLSSDSATALATQQSIKAYVDSQVTAQDLDISDGSSTIAIDLDSETLSLLGGTGITSTASGNGVTFAIGQSVGTSDNVVFNQVTGALVGNASTATTLQNARTISGVSFDGSANITLDTDDIGEGSSNKYFTAERVDDQVNTLLTAGANISLTYDDAGGTLTIANTNSADITSVVAGDGLTGGGTSGAVTLAVGVDDSSIEINSDALRVKASGITNAMLGGSIANAKLSNSSVTINSNSLSLGGTLTLDTDDIGEGSSNLYYTTARANSAIDARVTNTFINNLSGVVADTSTALATARTIALSGDVVGSVSFDGTSDVTISSTIQANSVALGTDTTGNYIQTITGTNNKISVSGSGSESADVTLTLPSDVQIANDLTVAGDLTVNGDLTYLDTTNLKIEDNLFELNANLTGSPVNDSGMLINRGNQNNGIFMWDESADKFTIGLTTADGTSTGNITLASLGTLVANLEGNVTGDVTGNVSGTAATVTGAAQTAITSVGTLTGLTTTGNINLGDNDKAIFGADSDLQINHDSNNSFVDHVGTGGLYLRGDTLNITSYTGTENYMTMAVNGAVTLHNNNVAKLSTTSTGIAVTGNIANTSGDLTLDVAGDIILDADGGDILFKDAGSLVGFLSMASSNLNLTNNASDGDIIFTGNDGGSSVTALTLDMSDAGTATFNHDIKLGDNGKAIFGAGSDLQIYHDGIHSRIVDAGTGNLSLQGNDLRIKNSDASATYIQAANGGAVELAHNNNIKLATTSSGIDVTGTVVADGITNAGGFSTITGSTGTSNQASINSGTTTGENLYVANTHKYLNGAGTEQMRITGTSVGIGTTSPGFPLHINSSSTDVAKFQTSGSYAYTRFQNSSKTWALSAGSSFGFYDEAAGATRMVIDSSGNVGIAETSPDNKLQISDSSVGTDVTADDSNFIKLTNKDAGTVNEVWGLGFSTESSGTDYLGGFVQALGDYSSNFNTSLIFGTRGTSGNATERMRIDSSGNATFTGVLTANAGVVVDNITIDGTEIDSSGALTLDAAGQLNIDSGNDEIHFRGSGTTFGKFYTSGGDFYINHPTADEDIIFTGNDGGSAITALTLDMSNAGRANFNNDIALNDNRAVRLGSDDDAAIYNDGSNTYIKNGTSNQDIIFQGNDDGSAGTTALTLDMSDAGKATFNGTVKVNGAGNTLELNASSGVTYQKFSENGTSRFFLATLNGADGLAFVDADGSAERMRIDSTGNLLIGATSGTSIQLNVDGSRANGLAAQFSNSESSTGSGIVVKGGSSSSNYVADFRDYNNTNLVRITGEGKCGIGTTSPASPLHVNGNAQFGAGNSKEAFIQATNSGRVASNPAYSFNGDVDTGMFNPNTDNTIAFATGGSERMRIDSSGNVGIGTNSPTEKLHVVGNVNIGTGQLDLDANYRVRWGGSNNYSIMSDNNNYIQFNTAGSERMRIDSSGNLFVGTTSVYSFGSGSTTGFFVRPASYIGHTVSSGESAVGVFRRLDDGTMFRFYNSNSIVGSISLAGSSTAYNTSSDARLKDVTGEARGLEVINELNPVAYNWKADGKADEGLIAQEVLDIVPNAVSGSEEEMYQMDYSKLVTPLIKAVQEQQELITTLQAEVALLKEK